MDSLTPDLFKYPPDATTDPIYNNIRELPHNMPRKNRIVSMWIQFYKLGLGDHHFVREFSLHFCQRWWELEVASFLIDHGFSLSRAQVGPDFKCTKNDTTVYVECVTSESEKIHPANKMKKTKPDPGSKLSEIEVPELLRITNSITSKVKKYHKYLEKKYIQKEIPCIIAFSPVGFPFLISESFDMPAVIKAVYPVGKRYISIIKQTAEFESCGWTNRSLINNHNKMPVNTDIFLPNPKGNQNNIISGILYSADDFERSSFSPRNYRNGHPFIYIHNLDAENSVSIGFFGNNMDYWCEINGSEIIIQNNTLHPTLLK